MRHAFWMRLVLVFVAGLAAAACDNGEIPTTPTNPTTTETFTGSVSRHGSQIHSFAATARGTVTARITAIDPADSPALGFSMGLWDGTVCTAVVTNNNATTSSVHTGTVVGLTSLCIRLFDPFGNVPADAPVNYTVTVEHP